MPTDPKQCISCRILTNTKKLEVLNYFSLHDRMGKKNLMLLSLNLKTRLTASKEKNDVSESILLRLACECRMRYIPCGIGCLAP